MSPNAVIYIRVSSEDQADSGLGLQAQDDACRAFAGRNGWPILATYRDEGVSGSKPLDKRPGLFGAIGALGRGDVLLVAKRDRVFRTDDYDRAVILRAIASRTARLASAAGEVPDEASADGRMLATILDAVGAREREAGIGRTKAAMRVKRDRMERCGQIPYGFRLADDGRHVEPDADELAMIEAARRLRAEGCSIRGIGARLFEQGFRPKGGGAAFAPTTIRRILREGVFRCRDETET